MQKLILFLVIFISALSIREFFQSHTSPNILISALVELESGNLEEAQTVLNKAIKLYENKNPSTDSEELALAYYYLGRVKAEQWKFLSLQWEIKFTEELNQGKLGKIWKEVEKNGEILERKSKSIWAELQEKQSSKNRIVSTKEDGWEIILQNTVLILKKEESNGQRVLNFYEQKSIEKAVEHLNYAIEFYEKKDPKNYEIAFVYYYLGKIEVEFANLEETLKEKFLEHINTAIEYLDKSIAINPKFVDAYYFRGIANSKNGNIENIIRRNTTTTLENQYGFSISTLYEGEGYTQKGFFDKSIEDFNKAIRLNPQNAEAYLMRGVINYIEKNSYDIKFFDKSIEDFNEAIRLNPQNAEAYLMRGVIEMDMNLEGAIENFSQVIKTSRSNLILSKAYYYRGFSKKTSRRPIEDSINDFSESIKNDTEFAESYFARGNIYLGEGYKKLNNRNNLEKIKEFEEAIKDYLQCLYIIESVYKNSFKNTIRFQHCTIYHNPTEFLNKTLIGIGDIKFLQNKLDESICYYDSSINLGGNSYFKRGNAKFKKGDLNGAIGDFNQAIKIALKTPTTSIDTIYLKRGSASLEKGNLNDAIGDFNSFIATSHRSNNTFITYFWIGIIKLENYDLDDAIRYFDRAVHQKPDCVFVYFLRGRAKFEKGDTDEALKDFNLAINNRPIKETISFFIDIYDSERLKYYNKMLTIEPYFYRAWVKAEQKKREEAIKDLKVGLALYEEFYKELQQPFYRELQQPISIEKKDLTQLIFEKLIALLNQQARNLYKMNKYQSAIWNLVRIKTFIPKNETERHSNIEKKIKKLQELQRKK